MEGPWEEKPKKHRRKKARKIGTMENKGKV
jgi:hypothetical protein